MTESSIHIQVGLDEDKMPVEISWSAPILQPKIQGRQRLFCFPFGMVRTKPPFESTCGQKI